MDEITPLQHPHTNTTLSFPTESEPESESINKDPKAMTSKSNLPGMPCPCGQWK